MVEVSLIILAGGEGSRMSGDVPKQFSCLNDGRRVVDLVLQSYESIDKINKKIFSYNKKFKDLSETICRSSTHKYTLAEAGVTRQESLTKAISFVNSDYVIIHDTARPLIQRNVIMEVINKLLEGNDLVHTVFPTYASTFAVKEDSVISIFDRGKIVLPQCPIGFRTSNLKEYLDKANKNKKEFKDDMSLVLYTNKNPKVIFVKGNQEGFKITYKEDMTLLEAFVKLRRK